MGFWQQVLTGRDGEERSRERQWSRGIKEREKRKDWEGEPLRSRSTGRQGKALSSWVTIDKTITKVTWGRKLPHHCSLSKVVRIEAGTWRQELGQRP